MYYRGLMPFENLYRLENIQSNQKRSWDTQLACRQDHMVNWGLGESLSSFGAAMVPGLFSLYSLTFGGVILVWLYAPIPATSSRPEFSLVSHSASENECFVMLFGLPLALLDTSWSKI